MSYLFRVWGLGFRAPITYNLVVSTPYLVGITHKTVGFWGYRYALHECRTEPQKGRTPRVQANPDLVFGLFRPPGREPGEQFDHAVALDILCCAQIRV